MALPDLTVGVAFATNPADTPTYVTISDDDLLELSTERGRNEELGVSETGVNTIVFRNQQRKFDPLNVTSPYYPNVIPVRRSRIQATVLGTTYDVAVGDVEDWPQVYSGRSNTSPVRILDAFDAFNTADFSAARGQELSGARIAAILDAIGWPAGDRAIDTGLSVIPAETYEEDNALSAIQEVAAAESGLFFIDKSGKAVFHSRDRRWKPPYTSSLATFSNVPAGGELPHASVTLLYRRDRIWNRVALTQSGGATFVKADSTSQAKYRRRSFTKTYKLASANEVEAKAEYILGVFKDAIVRPDLLVLEPQSDDALWAQCLGREIGDRITVKVQPPGAPTQLLSFDCHIEKIEHKYVVGRWTTTFRLSPADLVGFWILGTSALGIGTRLGY